MKGSKDMALEQWKTIDGYNNYQVSNLGRVRSIRRIVMRDGVRPTFYRGRVLSSGEAKNGYLVVVLSNSERTCKTVNVHSLVADAFLPPRPSDGHEVNHIDGNKANPNCKNLEWKTHSGNAKHSIRTGLRKIFAFHGTTIKNPCYVR